MFNIVVLAFSHFFNIIVFVGKSYQPRLDIFLSGLNRLNKSGNHDINVSARLIVVLKSSESVTCF